MARENIENITSQWGQGERYVNSNSPVPFMGEISMTLKLDE